MRNKYFELPFITNDFLLTSIFVLLVLLSTWFVLFVLKKAIYKISKIDQGRKYAIFQILKYFILVISISLILQGIGFNITVLIASSAALLVGLGMGIQNLFGDLVAGFIVLLDGTVKVGDIIELEGVISIVKDINLRTTTVETRDDKNIILPNSSLTNKNLINWTHSKISSRSDITVGVDYSTDVKLAMSIVQEVASKNGHVLRSPEPFVRLEDFGDSSLVISLFFWTDDVFRVRNVKSDIRLGIFEEFNRNGIVIPFPQRTLHVKN
jgi:small-conductance mechanosensitive channel